MSNEVNTQTGKAPASAAQSERKQGKKKLSAELSILIILIGIAALFEVVGWVVKGESFLFNPQRLFIIVLQVSIVGLLAIAVTQVIITGGIDLSSGSVLALSAVVAASLAQTSENTRALYPALTNLPFVLPLLAGVLVGCLAGVVNGTLIARTGIPPFIATLGMMVTARGFARAYTGGQPISMLSDKFTWIGSGYMPVVIFLVTAVHLPHCPALYALRQIHLCHRRQPAGSARLGHQCGAPSDHRIHDRGSACGTRRCRYRSARGDRSVGHGLWAMNSMRLPRLSSAARALQAELVALEAPSSAW